LRSTNFEIEAGDNASVSSDDDDDDDDDDGLNDPTVGITRYLHWRISMDLSRSAFHSITSLLKLYEQDEDLTILPRAFPNDPIVRFLVEKGCGKKCFLRHMLRGEEGKERFTGREQGQAPGGRDEGEDAEGGEQRQERGVLGRQG